MISLTLMHNGREERHQFSNRENVWRLRWERSGWFASKQRACNCESGDWLGIGESADDLEWCRVVGKREVSDA